VNEPVLTLLAASIVTATSPTISGALLAIRATSTPAVFRSSGINANEEAGTVNDPLSSTVHLQNRTFVTWVVSQNGHLDG
jgi:hypothetical protein